MIGLAGLPVIYLAEVAPAAQAMQHFITPVIATLGVLASLACVFFLVHGGILYMASTGSPDKLDQAKRIIRNALVGLVLVLAAASLTAILAHAYTSAGSAPTQSFPTLQVIDTPKDNSNVWDVMFKAVVNFLRHIVEAAADPFLKAISYFINNTPLMGSNSSVFNLWLAIVGIADVLFVLVVGLIGFQIMSFESLGIDEIDIKQLLPRLAMVFLLMNTSIFAIDAVISLSNGMIYAIQSGFPSTDIWSVLANLTKDSSKLGIVGLLIMVALLVLTIMLLVYYVLRLVTLYIGAVLSPLVVMLWLLPAFKDFALTALKTYLVMIFVLFVHAVIMLLAASLFLGMQQGDNAGQPNTLMALIVGLATILALLKTQSVLQELSYAASAPRAARELSSSFMRSVGYINHSSRNTYRGVNSGRKLATKVAGGVGTKLGMVKPKEVENSKTTKNDPISTSDAPKQTGQTVKAKKGKSKS
jgi:hypothetical protein